MKKIYFTLCFIFCMISSCIDDFNPDLGPADHNIIVVEGNIISDTICTFYLSRGLGLDEGLYDSDPLIDNATVAIIGSDGSNIPARHSNYGAYTANVGKLSPDVKYSLEIHWDGVTFTSVPSEPIDAPEISAVTFDQPRSDGQIDVMVTNAPMESGEVGFYKWTYNEAWEIKSKFSPNFEYDMNTDKVVPITIDKSRGWAFGRHRDIIIANSSKFEGNQIKDFRLYSIEHTDPRVSVLYSCEIKQFAMSKAQYEYELARQELSSNMGGMFAPLPSELFTNIKPSDKSHRAIGYVGVCGKVSSHRLWIKRAQINYYDQINRYIELLDDYDLLHLPYMTLFLLNYRIADECEPMESDWQWVERRGVDVTALGATLNKPSFWPN